MISCGSRDDVVFMLHVKRSERGFTGSGSPLDADTGVVITGLWTRGIKALEGVRATHQESSRRYHDITTAAVYREPVLALTPVVSPRADATLPGASRQRGETIVQRSIATTDRSGSELQALRASSGSSGSDTVSRVL